MFCFRSFSAPSSDEDNSPRVETSANEIKRKADESERYGILTVDRGAVNQRFTVLPVIELGKKTEGLTGSHETLSCSAEHQNLRPILKKRGNGVQVNIGECQTDITALDSVRVSHFYFAFFLILAHVFAHYFRGTAS